jgi:hypothetical protein
MAVPAGFVLTKAADVGGRAAGALYQAATTPLLRRHTIQEVQTDEGPKLVEHEMAVPAWLVAFGLGVAAVGLQRGIRTGTVAVTYKTVYKTRRVPSDAYKQWLASRPPDGGGALGGLARQRWRDSEPTPEQATYEEKYDPWERPVFRLRSRENIADYLRIGAL